MCEQARGKNMQSQAAWAADTASTVTLDLAKCMPRRMKNKTLMEVK